MRIWLTKLMDKIFLFLGAFVFSQFPLFVQYYTQQLSGRVNELQWQIDAIRQVASQSGKSIDLYIQKFINSTDVDFVLQGQFMQQLIYRWNHYYEGLFALEHSTIWMKPVVFLRYFDWTVARSTYEKYDIGLSFNMEGIIFGIIGIILGYCFSLIVKLFFNFLISTAKKLTFSPRGT